MDWIVQTLAVAGFTILVLGIVLVSTARQLRDGSRPSGRRHPVRGLDLPADEALRQVREPLFDQGVEVGHPTEDGDLTVVALGWQGQRWRLELGEMGAVLVGPEGELGEEMVAMIEATAPSA